MKKLKIGVIGAGRIGKVHTETIVQNVPEAEVIAIADVNLSEANLLRKNGNSKSSNNYKDILTNPEIDAVLICSRQTHMHNILWKQREQANIYSVKNLLI
jgi:myo-inositol 2-dehydrogenase/D-chiro-inositol 1-dehydrogenase